MLDHAVLGARAELAEIAAWADMMAAMPAAVAEALGAEGVFAHGTYAITASRVPLVTFNRAIGAGLLGPVDLVGLAGHLRRRAARVAQLQIAPQYLADLQPEAAGFAALPQSWVKMGRRSGAEMPAGALDIGLAGPEAAAEFGAVVCAGFAMPPALRPWLAALAGRRDWRCYLARREGRAVAGAALFLGGESAWLGVAATLPEARGLGAQGALIARRLADAAEAGHDWAFTETAVLDGPNPSLANMHRAGFEPVHERRNWSLP